MNKPTPIYLRAHADIPPLKKAGYAEKQSERFAKDVLIFDCETTIDTSQSLTFGSYAICQLDHSGSYSCVQEGLFYADETRRKDLDLIIKYAASNEAEVEPRFSKRMQVMSRRAFVESVFFKFAYGAEALVCGFNRPFDLTRIALDARSSRGNKGWSLIMSQ